MRPEKEAIVREIKDQMSEATFAIFTDYTKMDMVRTTALRKKLRETGARFQVVPNRLFGVVAKELNYTGLEAALKGPTAIVFGSEDVAATAKALKEFIRAEKIPVVKMGQMDGVTLSAEEVDVLATLPSKKVMQGMFVATLAAPMSNLVGVMSQKLASLVYVLKAAADKKNVA
jgi:large subunit ribosomal protein L10